MKTLNQVTESKEIIAAVPVIRKKIALTPLEKDIAHKKGRLMFNFLREIDWVLQKGLISTGKKCSNTEIINLGYTWNKNVIIGKYPDFKIDLKKVVISKGDLSKPERATVKMKTKSKVEMSWKKTLGENANATDQMCWMAYNVSNKESMLITSESLRCSGKDTLILEWPDIAGDEIHYWMFFISKDGRNRSDSVYLGILE